jgi:hypothetical protein
MPCGAMRRSSFLRPPCRPWLPPARARRFATRRLGSRKNGAPVHRRRHQARAPRGGPADPRQRVAHRPGHDPRCGPLQCCKRPPVEPATSNRSTIRPSRSEPSVCASPRLRVITKHVSTLVDALVDVWKALGMPFTTAQIVPLRRPPPECVYPKIRKAAE